MMIIHRPLDLTNPFNNGLLSDAIDLVVIQAGISANKIVKKRCNRGGSSRVDHHRNVIRRDGIKFCRGVLAPFDLISGNKSMVTWGQLGFIC